MYPYDPATSLPHFRATLVQDEGGTPIVSVFGEVDLYNVHDLDVLMLRAIAEAGEGGSVIVDLSGAEFMDLSVLNTLVNNRRALENSPGGSLSVICIDQVRRLFEITGLVESFELYSDLEEAVAGHPVGA